MVVARLVAMLECTCTHSLDRRSHEGGISLVQLTAVPSTSNQAARIDWPLPVLTPMAHNFFSTDASKSAAFMLRYFAKTKLVDNGARCVDCKNIAIVEYCPRDDVPCMTMKFIEATAAPAGLIPMQDFVKSADESWSRVGAAATSEAHLVDYSPWLDFHDGISGDDFQAELAIQDGIMLQKYSIGHVLRVPLPHTTFTLELIIFDTTQTAKLLDYAGVKGPDLCRYNEKGLEGTKSKKTFWWKSTYAAPEPDVAAEFVVHALGARQVTSPFTNEEGRQDGKQCPIVRWLVLPANPLTITEEQALKPLDENQDYPEGLMLHFVKNRGWPESNPSIKSIDRFAEHQEKLRDLNADVVDQYMYNNIELQAESLDPFLTRFRRLDIPYIGRTSPKLYSVYISVPKNGIVIKIASSNAPTVLGDEAWPVEA